MLYNLLALTDPDDDSSPNAEEISKLDNAEKTLSTRSSVSNASDCQGKLYTVYLCWRGRQII